MAFLQDCENKNILPNTFKPSPTSQCHFDVSSLEWQQTVNENAKKLIRIAIKDKIDLKKALEDDLFISKVHI